MQEEEVGVGYVGYKAGKNQVINHTKVNEFTFWIEWGITEEHREMYNQMWFESSLEEGRMERIRIVTRLLPWFGDWL